MLAGSLALMVPGVGLPLALLVRHTRGSGTTPPEELVAVGRQRISVASVERLSHVASVLDRLMSSDATERLAALVAVSSAGGSGAVAMLRWTLDHGTTEVALDAALALEELEFRGEARRAAAQEALAAAPSYASALAVADAAAEAVLDRRGDGPGAAAIADVARAAYEAALAMEPGHDAEIGERLAQLELAAGRPQAALDALGRLAVADEGTARRTQLRDRAAFAARRFELLQLAPSSQA